MPFTPDQRQNESAARRWYADLSFETARALAEYLGFSDLAGRTSIRYIHLLPHERAAIVTYWMEWRLTK